MKYVACLLSILLLLPAIVKGERSDGGIEPTLLKNTQQNSHCQQWVDSVMNRLSLKEKVGQLFIYTIAPQDNKRNVKKLKEAVEAYKVGGLLFSGGYMQDQAVLTNEAQRMADIPLMITFDGEWGLAMRLKNTPSFPKNMVLGCIKDNALIHEYGVEMARQCKLMGVRVNFAPVADVNINPNNPVINSRSFGANPVEVAKKVNAYGKGLESGGVLSVSKHFPGHGDTDVDSHASLPVLPFTRERLDSVELYPFREAIDAGLSGIMVGHLQVPAIDSEGYPSSLSTKVVCGLLKEELGFKGLVFTDALAMKSVSGRPNVCLQALKAGNDMLLSTPDLDTQIKAVIEAIDNGDISIESIDEKCRKVLTYKYSLGLKNKPYVQLSGLEQRINNAQVYDLISRLNVAAITLVKNTDRRLPFFPEKVRKTALLEVGDGGVTAPFADQLSLYTTVTRFQIHGGLTDAESTAIRDSLEQYKNVIVAVSTSELMPYHLFLNDLTLHRSPSYVFFTPPEVMNTVQQAVKRAPSVVLGHSIRSDVQRQVADIIFGKATADGRLPEAIGTLFPVGAGVTLTAHSPYHFVPEEFGFSTVALAEIDTIALDGIRQGAFPGCQIVVLKDGKMIVDKTFGTHTGKGSADVRPNDIYDLASLSKTTGTVLALMKLYDQGRFNLSDRISDHLPFLKNTAT